MRLNRIKAALDQRDQAGYYSTRINEQWRTTFRIQNNRVLDTCRAHQRSSEGS